MQPHTHTHTHSKNKTHTQTDIPTVPGELFAKFQTSFYAEPIDAVVKADWSTYFVAPPHYFNLPKVAAFREWLMDQFSSFELPE